MKTLELEVQRVKDLPKHRMTVEFSTILLVLCSNLIGLQTDQTLNNMNILYLLNLAILVSQKEAFCKLHLVRPFTIKGVL